MAKTVDLLVSVAELEKLRVRGDVRVVDARWKLGEPAAGRALFEAGHVPGAAYVDMDTELAGPVGSGSGGRHPLPSAERFAEAMEQAGIDDETWVIAYDDGGSGAARLWWLLRHFGHERVSILDGGYAAWLAAGSTPEVHASQTQEHKAFTARPRSGDTLDTDEVKSAMESNAIHLLDARAPERWRGEVEPVDKLPGRIPGAINAPTSDTVRNGYFKSPEELRDYFGALGVLDGKPIVVSCGSGVSACVDLLAMELAGIHNAQLFPGSFSGWIAHGLPVQTGADQ